MPSIWNVDNKYNINNKKISSKLTFEVGERFSGRLISKGEDGGVSVKLSDGWQFSAEIKGEYPKDEQGLIRFEVEGFEDGKLKLKIVSGGESEKGEANDRLGEIINKESLSKEDKNILRLMVKYNMPLTKENIIFIKSLVHFNSKISSHPEEMNKFIEKFLASKGIAEESQRGQSIKNILLDFFESFKDLSEDDILLFLENDIELNKENIESYNNLFKSNRTIKELFDKVDTNLKKLDVYDIKNDINKSIISGNHDSDSLNDEQVINKDKMSMNPSNLYINNKDSIKEKVSMLSVLKSMIGSESDASKEFLREVLLSRKEELTTSEYTKAFSNINSISEDEVIKLIKNNISDGMQKIIKEDINILELLKDTDKGSIKEILSKAISDVLGKDIVLTENEIYKLKNIVSLLEIHKSEKFDNGEVEESNESSTHNSTKVIESNEAIKDIVEEENIRILERDKELSSKDIIKLDIKAKIDDIKETIKQLITHTDMDGESTEKIIQLLKGYSNDFKVFNSVSNQYYYLDIPIAKENIEYPCKLIIKDNRKDGKKIDKSNVKIVVSIKTVNLGIIDGYLSIRNGRIDVDLKCEENIVKVLNKGKEKLINGLETLGLNANIVVSKKVEEVTFTTCRDFFNDSHDKKIDTTV